MSTSWDIEQASSVVTAGAEPPEDWLAITIRSALWSSVGNAEPSPAIWDQIRQNIADVDLSPSHQGGDSVTLGHKDLPQETEQERLIRDAKHQQSSNWRLYRRVANWIGIQMVRWGRKLQRYGTVPSLCYPSCQ
jgi:hypothetical protein